MENLEIIYHILTFLLGLLIFSIEFTGTDTIIKLILKLFTKLSSVFIMFYSGLKLAIIVGLI